MAPAPRKQFVPELEPDSEPVVGCLRDDEGRRFEFTGWLGFSTALGQTLRETAEVPAAPDGGPPRSADR